MLRLRNGQGSAPSKKALSIQAVSRLWIPSRGEPTGAVDPSRPPHLQFPASLTGSEGPWNYFPLSLYPLSLSLIPHASWERGFPTADAYLRQVWDRFRVSYRWIELRDTVGAVIYSLGEAGRERSPDAELSSPGFQEGLQFTHSILDPNNSVPLGEVVAGAPMDQVLPPDALAQMFGRSGYSVVLDLLGDRVLSHPRRAELQARASSLVGPDGWGVNQERLAQESGSFVFRLTDSARVASFVSMETPAWTVLATTSVEEFSGPFTRMRRLNLIIVGLVTAAVFLAFLLMTGRATRSLESLTRAAPAWSGNTSTPGFMPRGVSCYSPLIPAFDSTGTTPMDDKALLLRAIQLARVHSRTGRNGPFGAVVARRGEVLGEGWNQVVRRKDPTAHAEIQAIREAAVLLGTHLLADCTLYCSCEPCPMCLAAVYWARIPRVVFAATGEDAKAAGFDDTRIGRELALDWEERGLAWDQLLQEEGKKVLEAWGGNPDRTQY